LNDLAKQTIPFLYQSAIEGIKEVLKECWNIYTADTTVEKKGKWEGINWNHKLVALKLAKECQEGMFKILYEAPMVIYANTMHEKLEQLRKGIAFSNEQQLKEIKYVPGVEYQQSQK
jgi:hypothetical protein